MSPEDTHERWAELAAGHALSALEPDDEAAFVEHVVGCQQCRALVADVSAVMAQMAESVSEEPPLRLREAILREVDDDGRRFVVVSGAAEPPVRDSAPRAKAASRWGRRAAGLAVAAGLMLLAAIATGIWALVGQRGGAQQQTVAQRCASVHCPTAELNQGGHHVATVMLLSGAVWVDTAGLPPTDSTSSYVLWRIGADGTPVGVASFAGNPDAGAVQIASLTTPVADAHTFAVSKEPGHTVPAAPSDVVAQGTVA